MKHLAVLLTAAGLLTACETPDGPAGAEPIVPFEASRLCHGTYADEQLEAWFQSATPTVMGIQGVSFFDHDELAHCLRIGVVDRPAGEAEEQALAHLTIPRDAAIIEFAELPSYAMQ